MRAVLQRVNSASVEVDGKIASAIKRGWLVFLGVERSDTAIDANYLADKTANLRLFSDVEGKFNLSVLDLNVEILVVSQFTLLGDCRKGRRPSFSQAAPPEIARTLYEHFIASLRKLNLTVEAGVFQTHMRVKIENDGPVTILLDSRKEF